MPGSRRAPRSNRRRSIRCSPGQAPAGGDFGRYFKSALQSGKTLLAFEDGSPFLAEDGNVLQFAAGIGGALLPGELFYDKLFLRAAALGNAPALAALAAREDEVTSRRRAEEAKYVESRSRRRPESTRAAGITAPACRATIWAGSAGSSAKDSPATASAAT